MKKSVVRVKAVSRSAVASVVPFRQPSPDDSIGNLLTQFSEMNDDGSIVAIAVSAVRRGGDITTAFVSRNHLFPLIGAVAAVDTRLRKEIET